MPKREHFFRMTKFSVHGKQKSPPLLAGQFLTINLRSFV
ncbi:hypothetical protein VCPCS022_000733 [Vibrio cholerae O1 str. PCS-022]|uniref:Uncharacterized protein n=1 Tax=Vibrio fluvialis TaxID=676 RepID=C9E5S3_VIBFL|nr:hypothetical protein ICEVFLIND1_0060 [Vibrio fluvialis Ind1]EJH41240.1 hypothetical protein VCCP104215_1672 [Vibrio cholerae CP1042(15)]EMQ29017.1 hypothetical protein VCEM1536_000735 [Vibrio cholerae O1 str. EM-1536]EMQ29326.1 hypothetical protein VCEDC022_000727 [Vibrio cholerae O1 str. EDC-022]EMQ40830.1 hypothetical protein VCEM1626_000736 [Vibrio cholerae O1 str. EM-1626]EWM33630.1 hypothetical protein VCPCS022_000733 [Vibrio cholerae O1 str. PCS-022]KKP09870.1 hypothetical protein VP